MGAPSGSSGSGRLRRTTGTARIAVRFKRLPGKREALALAMQKFADQNGQFDRKVWTTAFESDEPEMIVDVHGLTGVFEDLMNNLTEMMLTAAGERGVAIRSNGVKPKAPDLFDAIANDGGLTADQVNTLKDLNWVRNQLQHSSPVITADEAYDGIVRLNRLLVPLLQSYVNWLRQHGLDQLLAR